MGCDHVAEISVTKKEGKNKILHQESINEKAQKGLRIDHQKLSSLSSSDSASSVVELMIGLHHLNITADNLLV